MVIKGKARTQYCVQGYLTCETPSEQEILVTNKPSFTNIDLLITAKAVIFSDKISYHSHASLLFFDYFIPFVHDVGPRIFNKIGYPVTILCQDGIAQILDGFQDFEIADIPTKMNCAFTSTKKGMSICCNSGANLVSTRGEFIYLQSTKMYPLDMLQNKHSLQTLKNKYIDILNFAGENFRRVIHRFSDFSSENLSHLYGYENFEVNEGNSFVGNRGTYRLLNSFYRYFELEIEIIQSVYNNYNHLDVLLPFVRSIGEALEATQVVRNKFSGRLGCMIEVPLMLYEFSWLFGYFDFFVVGTSDLLQLLQGKARTTGNYSENAYKFLADLIEQYILNQSEKDNEIFIVSEEVYKLLPKNKANLNLLSK